MRWRRERRGAGQVSFGPPAAQAFAAPAGEVPGLACTVRAGQAAFHVPPGFGVAEANAVAEDYLRLIAAELNRLPHRYAYDPASVYSVLVQTWDRALVPVRSLAFGRDVLGHGEVGLIPDAYYIASHGYAVIYDLGLRLPAWARRSPLAVWRGSVTGRGGFERPADIPRVRLALACRDLAGTDVALIGVHETMQFPRAVLDAFLTKERLLAPAWPVRDFAFYRFVIDIDGHANAWGLLEKLILGCCVLKVESPYEQWYYPRLRPFVHYVPVAADLSDLGDALAWCQANDARCQWIAANGARLAATLRLQAELPRSCLAFMRTAQAAPD